MPGPVEERLAVALGLDRAARGGIDRLAGDARADRPRRRRLGAVQDAEQVAEPLVGALRRIAAGDPQRPRDVRAVAAERAADVEDDRLAGLDDPVGRLVVRRGRVRARSRRSRTGPSSWPSAMSRSRTSRATSASVRPTSRPAAIWATTRSAACGGQVSSAISSASLTIRSSREDRRGELEAAPSASVGPGARSRWRRRQVVRDGDRGRPRGSSSAPRTIAATSAYGSSRLLPGHDREVPGGSRRAGRRPSPPAAARRATARRPAGMTSIVSRSRGIAG